MFKAFPSDYTFIHILILRLFNFVFPTFQLCIWKLVVFNQLSFMNVSLYFVLANREPQRQQHQHRQLHQQHRVVLVYLRAPHHPYRLCLLRNLLGTPLALTPHMNLASCQLVGRSAVLPMEDPFSLTTIQRRLPGWESSRQGLDIYLYYPSKGQPSQNVVPQKVTSKIFKRPPVLQK